MGGFITLIFLGILLIVIGALNMMGNISSIKRQNRRNVRPEDVPSYGKCVGIGTAVIGAATFLYAILGLIFDTPIFAFVLLVGIIVGMAFILYGQFKYNKGIF